MSKKKNQQQPVPQQAIPTNIQEQSGHTRVDLAAQVQAPPANPKTEIKVIRLVTGEDIIGHLWENRIWMVIERPVQLHTEFVPNPDPKVGGGSTQLRIDPFMPFTSAARQLPLHYGIVGFVVDPSIDLAREYLRATGQEQALQQLEAQIAQQNPKAAQAVPTEAATIYDEFENAEDEQDADDGSGKGDE